MKIDAKLLQKYGSDSCTEEEKIAVEQWLAAEEPDVQEVEELTELDGAFLWKNITEQVQHSGATSPKRHRSASRILGLPWAIAASLLLAISIGSIWFFLQHANTKQETSLAMKEIRVPKGKKMRIVLPDQSIVHLNADSKLSYGEPFIGDEGTGRLVSLQGEGFFEVAHDSLRPFIIETASTRTEVLGTKFNLQQYANETAANLQVTQGRVRFSDRTQHNNLIVTVNEAALFNAGQLSKETIDATQVSSWMNNVIRFPNNTLEEAATIIARWYNVDVKFEDDSLRKKRIKASFDNPSMEELLKEINYLLNINAHYSGGIVKFKT